MKKTIQRIYCVLLLFTGQFAFSQMSGIYSVPSTYTSVGAAIAALNSQGVNGAVTVNIASGHTETVTTGGYTLTATGTSANPITFRKSGTGANPLLTAFVGTATPASATQDGVWRLIGSDFITIDGIDITDPNTTNPGTMEFGYGLLKASAGNGCQNNTIRNCVVSLQRVNSVAGSGPSIEGSKGISLVNATTDAHTTAVTATSTAGSNSFNKFYSNTILNCHIGICLIGYADASPFYYADTDNDVGGTSAATGNTITNFGGGGTTASAGVSALAQYNINVSYNVLNSNNGSGANHAGILRGIFLNTATSANAAIRSNTVTLKAAGTTQVVNAIHNISGATAASNTISITNNLITNCSYTTASSGDFSGIINTASSQMLEIIGNTLLNTVMKSTSGQCIGFNNTGAVAGQIKIQDNINSNIAYHPTTGVFRNISNTSGGANATVTIGSNTLSAMTCTSAPSGIHSFIYNSASTAKNEISNNTAVTHTFFTTGTAYFIYNSNSTENNVVSNNYNTGSMFKTGSGNSFYCYYNFGSPSSGTATISGNNFSNITLNGTTAFYGIYAATTVQQVEIVSSNTVANVTTSGSLVYPIYHSYGASGSMVTGNTISGLTSPGAITGIVTGSVAGVQLQVSNNTIHTFSCTGPMSVAGISPIDGGITNIHGNKIYNLAASNASADVSGIYIEGGVNTGVYNNLIGDLRASAATQSNAVTGITVYDATAVGIYYNTVYLNATSSGSAFGTSALYASTVTSLDMRNNILSNVSSPTGTGSTVAFRSDAAISTFSLTSNNNIFYAGTPGTYNLIFSDGTNSYQTLAAYKAAVSPREVNSITEITPFLSVSGASANFLHIDPTVPSLAESGGVNYAGITSDFDLQIRHGNSGYSGTGTAPDIGADEFNQTLPACSGVTAASISAVTYSSCAGHSLSLYSTGYSTGSGITYQWQVSASAGGPYTNVSGPNGNHHAYSSANHSVGALYFVMVTTCSVGPVSATSNELSYTVAASPSSSITAPASVCNGGSLALNGGSDVGTSFSWTGPNGFVSASQNTVIAGAGLSASGLYSLVTTYGQCISPVTQFSVFVSQATVNIVNPAPTLCYGNSATLTAVGESGATYTWSSGPSSNSISISPLVSTVYNVTATNVYNCSVAATTSVSVVNVTIAAQGASVCPDVTGTLSVNAYTPGFVNWYSSSTSTTSIGTGSTYTVSAPTNTTIYAEASSSKSDSLFTNVAGTAAFLGEMFDVVPLKNMVIKGFDCHFAAGSGTIEIWYRYGTHVGNSTSSTGWTMASSVTLTSLGVGSLTPIPATLNIPAVSGQTVAFYIVANTGPNVRYSTATLLGAVYAQNSDIQILQGTTGNTYFSCTTQPRGFNGQIKYDLPGCTSPRIPVTLTVNPIPTITVAQSSTAVCYSTAATFTASGASTYTWVNGPVSSSFSANPVAAAVYTVNGTSLAGCTGSATASISVNPLPVISVAQSSTAVCYSTTATFTASGANTYSWVNGPTTAAFSVTPVANSVYTVSGTSVNGCTSSATASVAVNPLPTLTLNASSGSVCATFPVTLSVNGAASYTWNTSSNDSVIVDNPTSSTGYTVTGENTLGCLSVMTTSVGVNALPVVVIASSAPTVCANGPLSFTASGATSYQWSTGANTNTLLLTPTANTFVTVTGTDAAGCYGKDSIGVSVSPLPVVTIAQSASSVCVGSVATFTANGAGTYSWNTGPTTAVTAVTITAHTVYTVTGTDALGCAANATAEVHSLALPSVSASPVQHTICENESTTLTASGALSYTWLPGGSTLTVLSASPAGTTSFTLTGTGANGCVNSAYVTITVDACTGIAEKGAHDMGIRVYPNPTRGMLHLDFPDEISRQIQVLNSVGQVIYSSGSNGSNETLDLNGFARGLYYVRIVGPESESTFRIITQD